MTIPLTVDPDHAQIDQLRPRLAGQSCVVVGSAPLKTRRAVTEPGEYVICVNGSISSIAGTADLWLLNSKPNRSYLHLTMLQQGRGRSAVHVAFLRGPLEATERKTLGRLDKMKCRYTSWSVIDKPIKRWLEETICDRRLEGDQVACSAGVFAVALALWSGAARVRMVGFAWRAGYQYLASAPTTRRGHVESDRRALRALTARYPGRLEGALMKDLAVAS